MFARIVLHNNFDTTGYILQAGLLETDFGAKKLIQLFGSVLYVSNLFMYLFIAFCFD